MANPNLSQITADAFVEFGGSVFGKLVLQWKLRSLGIQVRTNVTAPQVLPKISATGTPRPYRAQDDTTSNGVEYTDRVLTAHNSKWDYDFDPEEFRNTYLAAGVFDAGYARAAAEQMAKEYLALIIKNTLWLGSYNASGTTPAAICDGWGKIIADEITATTLTPIATGIPTSGNAVELAEQMVEEAPIEMRDNDLPLILYSNYNFFDNYCKRYRELNGFGFNQSSTGDYKMDNKNCIIRPVAMIPSSSNRLALTVANNLVFGTDIESIRVSASVRRNIIECRPMMAAGCQINDLDLLVVNDQA